MVEQPGQEVVGDVGEPLVAVAVQQVRPGVVRQRQVQVEAGSLVVVPGLADERGQQPVDRGHLLDHVLEQVGAVGCVQRVGVAQVDLVLRAAELVVGGVGAEIHVDARVQHPAQQSARVGNGAHRVDVAVVVDVAAVAVGGRRVGLA